MLIFMPREDRRIMFDNEEVYKALYSMTFQKQMKQPPPGNIVKITEDEQNKGQILVVINNPLEQKETNLEYTQDFMAAALMLFCKGCGIPLPKSAKKSVVINEGQITLRVQI
jgi:hypothetical protein